MPTAPIVDFLNRVVNAFGISATVEVEETADGPRFNIAGEELRHVPQLDVLALAVLERVDEHPFLAVE